jgi:hypothetical protein
MGGTSRGGPVKKIRLELVKCRLLKNVYLAQLGGWGMESQGTSDNVGGRMTGRENKSTYRLLDVLIG